MLQASSPRVLHVATSEYPRLKIVGRHRDRYEQSPSAAAAQSVAFVVPPLDEPDDEEEEASPLEPPSSPDDPLDPPDEDEEGAGPLDESPEHAIKKRTSELATTPNVRHIRR